MHKVDEKIQAELWERDGDQLRFAAETLVRNGAPRERGKTTKQALGEAVIALVRVAYLVGLARGYDMGAKVFGDQPDEE